MNTKNTSILLTLSLLATIFTTTHKATGTAPDKTPAAFGEGQFTFEQELVNFSFDADTNKKGKFKGRAQFDNLSAQTRIVVKIVCLSVDSFSAVMSGTVQHSDDPAFPKFANVIFAATDGDAFPTPRPDDITPLFLTPSPDFDCNDGSPLTILPLNEGDIGVQP